MSPCLEGAALDDGYPYKSTGKFMPKLRLHRLLATLAYGDAEGHVVHHLCHNKACYRPDHLVWLTAGEHQRVHRLGFPSFKRSCRAAATPSG